MGCAPSRPELSTPPQAHADGSPAAAAAAAAAAGPRGKLNPQLSEKLRHPSAIPRSFYDREHDFRQTQLKKAVAERRQGPCRLRIGRGGWKDGWCQLVGRQLHFYLRSGGGTDGSGGGGGAAAAMPPVEGASPDISLELVGAHLQLERKQELTIQPPGGGHAALLLLPDEQQRDEWMVGLGSVSGLFRRVQDFYELGGPWGHGATCTVYECRGRYSGQRYALKTRLHKSREATQAMHNELRILQICAKKPHPAIPQLHDYFFDEDGSIELVMDLMEGGELFDHIAMADQLREADARAIFKQVAEGVAHLHSLGIAHRDLKPQNLMYMTADEGAQVKIMDYDLARVNYAPTWEGHTPCGTIHYMAPEIVQHQKYSLAVDMWSLGVILFILLTGRMPFDGKDSESIAQAIEAGQYTMDHELWDRVSGAAKDLVHHLLQVDPEQRLSAQQVLRHPWLTAPLDAATSVELRSPAVLRNTLSKTARGRQLLALAALTYSEGDLRKPVSAATKALLARKTRLGAEGQAAPPLSALTEVLDFDMQPIRDQALGGGGGGGARTAAAGGAAAAAAAAAAGGAGAGAGAGGTAAAQWRRHSGGVGAGSTEEGEVQEEDEERALATLRCQLDIIGTAAGLQDRRALELEGQQLLGGSPRHGDGAPEGTASGAAAASAAQAGAAAVADLWGQQPAQGAPPAAAAAAAGGSSFSAALDGLAELCAVEVEESELGWDSESNLPTSSSLSRAASGERGRLRAVALQPWPSLPSPGDGNVAGMTAQPPPPLLAPLQLQVRLPPEAQLPPDTQLLAQLEQQQRGSGGNGGTPGAAGAASTSAAAPQQQQGQGGTPLPAPGSAVQWASRSDVRCQPPGSGGGGGGGSGGLFRSTSTSVLKLKESRIPQSELEPVDLAMRQKLERLSALATPSGRRHLHRSLTSGR